MISRLRRGEPWALSRAYHEYAAMLLRTAYHITGRRAEAEDVVQDLFVGLPEALAHYDERGRFEPWLRKVAVRLALMRKRSKGWSRQAELDEAHQAEAQPGPPMEGIALTLALERLPVVWRTVVVLKVIEGYSHEEIAGILGIRRGTSEVRLHRALARMRKWLEDRP